jgi:hypothetical protein
VNCVQERGPTQLGDLLPRGKSKAKGLLLWRIEVDAVQIADYRNHVESRWSTQPAYLIIHEAGLSIRNLSVRRLELCLLWVRTVDSFDYRYYSLV